MHGSRQMRRAAHAAHTVESALLTAALRRYGLELRREPKADEQDSGSQIRIAELYGEIWRDGSHRQARVPGPRPGPRPLP
jgi:hypothetical protein